MLKGFGRNGREFQGDLGAMREFQGSLAEINLTENFFQLGEGTIVVTIAMWPSKMIENGNSLEKAGYINF